jgi:hypothetical protein
MESPHQLQLSGLGIKARPLRQVWIFANHARGAPKKLIMDCDVAYSMSTFILGFKKFASFQIAIRPHISWFIYFFCPMSLGRFSG